MSCEKVIIIGGGVIGGGIAFELALAGIPCELFEKKSFFSEASIDTAGLLGGQSVHFFGPGKDPAIHFTWESFKRHRHWTKKIEEVSGIPVQYQQEGILRLAITEEEKFKLKQRLSDEIFPVRWLDPKEVLELEPHVSEHIKGGVLFEEDAQILPSALKASLEKALKKLGVIIHSDNEVRELLKQGDKVIGIKTVNDQTILADTTILAAGAWSNHLLEPIGKSISLFPMRGQCFSVSPIRPMINKTIQTSNIYMLPRLDGTITIGATHLDRGYDKTPTFGELQYLLQTASNVIPELEFSKFNRTWVGLRPATRDGRPVIGRFPDLNGLIIATGHNSTGVIMAPLTAKVVFEELIRNDSDINPIDLEPFHPVRK